MEEVNGLKIFTGNSNPKLAADIASEAGVPIGKAMVTRFSDGEIRVKVEESVRGQDVFIVQSGCYPVNESVMELLVMLDTFRRASARRITAVIPYYGYSRQDKKVKPREPVSAKLMANLITCAGADRVLAMDLHSAQIKGFFDVPVDHLYAGPIIAEYLKTHVVVNNDTVVVSPDEGGVPRARAFAEVLGTPIAIIVKRRPEPNRAEVMEIIGDVKGKVAVMIDDMIDTGGSVALGASTLMDRGAKEVYACCVHPVLSGEAVNKLDESPIKKVIVTDTIPLAPEKQIDKIIQLSVARLLADAIERIHAGMSVSSLFNDSWTGQY